MAVPMVDRDVRGIREAALTRWRDEDLGDGEWGRWRILWRTTGPGRRGRHVRSQGDHLRALQTKGLTLRGPGEELHVRARAVEVPAEAGPVDLVLFTVKSYDTECVAGQIKPCLGPDTVVLTLQNGIGNAEKIGRDRGDRPGHGGSQLHRRRNRISRRDQACTAGRIAFGELDGSDTARGRAIAAACQKSGISRRVFAEHPEASLGKVRSDLRARR